MTTTGSGISRCVRRQFHERSVGELPMRAGIRGGLGRGRRSDRNRGETYLTGYACNAGRRLKSIRKP